MPDCTSCLHFHKSLDVAPCQSCCEIGRGKESKWEPAEPPAPAPAVELARAIAPLQEAFNAQSRAPATTGPVEPPAPGPSSAQLSGPPRCNAPAVVAGAVGGGSGSAPAFGYSSGGVGGGGDGGYVGFPDARPEPDSYHEAKHDLGKLRWDCLPWPAVEQVVAVLTFGAEKYSAWSWPSVPDARRRYFAAAIRHAVAWLRGEKTDPESGLPHLAHLACNALFLLSFDLDEAKPPPTLEEP